MKRIISLFFAVLLVAILSCCSKEIKVITDFSKFADMKREADRIEVTFDNHSGAPFYFTIEDQAEIDEIIDIIFSSGFNNLGDEPYAGDNTSLKIVQGEKEYSVHFRINKEGKNYYSFSTMDLQNKIVELARAAGAYDGVD